MALEDVRTTLSPCELMRSYSEGRISLQDVYHPLTDELLLQANQPITSKLADAVQASGIDSVEVRSALTCESLKLGPGDSTRSHSADEFIYVAEIEEGIQIYIELLNRVIV